MHLFFLYEFTDWLEPGVFAEEERANIGDILLVFDRDEHVVGEVDPGQTPVRVQHFEQADPILGH